MERITKEAFVALIEAIRLQTLKDRSNAITISEVFNSDGINTYDNSILINAIVSFLQLHFPRVHGHCDIEHYMFCLNFGKMGEQEVITIDDLWDQLTKDKVISWEEAVAASYNGNKHLTSTHPLIDDQKKSFVM
ncbi:hypothetical protein [Flavobacterium sp. FlaQc-50]|uniref:hypothetical protein n=1 Tax=unclassified Flavobacterium TaxID=196869 RepID=UPI0037577A27